MPADWTVGLYWGSLAIAAAAVVLFLWLMRDPSRKASGVRREAKPDDEKPASSA